MFKIGILGSDNCHALEFSKLCNICDENGKYAYDDVRVTAIYGFNDDPEHTKQVAKEGKVDLIVNSPLEMLGMVDAVMVVYRDGKYHLDDVLPFIEKGYPVWMDKPVVASCEDAKRLEEAIDKYSALVTGGSTLKYTHEVLGLRNKIIGGSIGRVSAGFVNFPANLKSQYSGIYFYASHLCEICLAIFGYDAKEVYTSVVDDGNFNVLVSYDDKEITMNFNEDTGDRYFALALGTGGMATTEIDLANFFKFGFEKFVQMLRSKKMPLTTEELLMPIYMTAAIETSISEKRKVKIAEMM